MKLLILIVIVFCLTSCNKNYYTKQYNRYIDSSFIYREKFWISLGKKDIDSAEYFMKIQHGFTDMAFKYYNHKK